ncbi:MAG: chromate transporter [Acidobacteria bacterium]|nr:chromate transporter [Acidobacteriota bacterium]
MSLLMLYLVMLKATLTTFNGPSSLPVLRHELVVKRAILTDRQLNAAVTAAQGSPGPMGIYAVSVGFFIAGVPGAVVGWLAVISPALLVIPILRYIGRRVETPRARGALEAVVLAGSALVIGSAVPLARDVVTGPFPAFLAVTSGALLIATRIDTLWLIAGAGMLSLAAALL